MAVAARVRRRRAGVEPAERGRPVEPPDERPEGRDPLGLEGWSGGKVDVRGDRPVDVAFSRGRLVIGQVDGGDSFPRRGWELVSPGPAAGQESVGTHDACWPKGTRAGRWTVATGGPVKDVASRMTRSLAPRVAS